MRVHGSEQVASGDSGKESTTLRARSAVSKVCAWDRSSKQVVQSNAVYTSRNRDLGHLLVGFRSEQVKEVELTNWNTSETNGTRLGSKE